MEVFKILSIVDNSNELYIGCGAAGVMTKNQGSEISMFVIKISSICLITLFCSSISSTASIDFSVKSRDLQFLMVDMEILFICLIALFLLDYLFNGYCEENSICLCTRIYGLTKDVYIFTGRSVWI